MVFCHLIHHIVPSCFVAGIKGHLVLVSFDVFAGPFYFCLLDTGLYGMYDVKLFVQGVTGPCFHAFGECHFAIADN